MPTDTLNDLLEKIPLAHGGHDAADRQVCLLELEAHIAGEDHTDQPSCVDPALIRAGQRLNDRANQEQRQQLKKFNGRMIGTANDGHQLERRIRALEFIRETSVLPKMVKRLDKDPLTKAWKTVQDLDLDKASEQTIYNAFYRLRDAAWEVRSSAYSERRDVIRAKIAEEFKKRGLTGPSDDSTEAAVAAAVAAAAADAVAVAVAAAAAVAVAAADAVAAAAADAVAAAAADAVAAAAADAVADAADSVDLSKVRMHNDEWFKLRSIVREALRKTHEERVESLIKELDLPTRDESWQRAMDLFEELVSIGEDERAKPEVNVDGLKKLVPAA